MRCSHRSPNHGPPYRQTHSRKLLSGLSTQLPCPEQCDSVVHAGGCPCPPPSPLAFEWLGNGSTSRTTRATSSRSRAASRLPQQTSRYTAAPPPPARRPRSSPKTPTDCSHGSSTEIASGVRRRKGFFFFCIGTTTGEVVQSTPMSTESSSGNKEASSGAPDGRGIWQKGTAPSTRFTSLVLEAAVAAATPTS